MKLVTRKSKAARLQRTLYNVELCSEPAPAFRERWREMRSKLDALGADPDPDALDEALGRPETWLRCDICDERTERAVVLSFEGDEREEQIAVCEDCVRKAHDLLGDAP